MVVPSSSPPFQEPISTLYWQNSPQKGGESPQYYRGFPVLVTISLSSRIKSVWLKKGIFFMRSAVPKLGKKIEHIQACRPSTCSALFANPYQGVFDMSIPQDALCTSNFWTSLGYIDSASSGLKSRLKHLSQIANYAKLPFAKLAIFPMLALEPHILPIIPSRLASSYITIAAVEICHNVTVLTVEICHKIRMILREFAYVSRDKTLVHMLASLRELAPRTIAARLRQPVALQSPEKRGSMNTYPNSFTRIPISSLMYTLIPSTFNYPYEGEIVGPLSQLPFGYPLDAPAYLLGCVNGSASSPRWQRKFIAMAARVRRKFRRRSDAVQTPAANLQLMKGGNC
jgi:hypothetical protein